MQADHHDHPDPDAGPAPIDREVLAQYRAIDPAGGLGLAQHLVKIYIESSLPTLQQAEQAAADGNAEVLRSTSHSLKSSSASIGATTLSGLFRELEAMAKAGRMAEVGPVIGRTRAEYERALVALRELLAEAP